MDLYDNVYSHQKGSPIPEIACGTGRVLASQRPDDYVSPDIPNGNLVEFAGESKYHIGKVTAVDLGCGEGSSSVFIAREGLDARQD